MAELLKRTSLSNTQQKYATTIMSSAESLLQIIEDILDFSRLDSGKLELDEIEADLEQLLNDSLAMFALAARKKGLQLVSFLPPGGLPILKLDTLRLRQVLVNLLSNAIKFTDRGYVKIAVELTGNDTESLTLRISISDTGIGIAPENQQHIFDSFAQEDSSTSRRFGGTGLGLAISRELIELMGGSLLLESTVGNGATFSFELRLEKAVPGAELDSSPEFQASALIACSGDAERQQLESYLNAWGVRTHCLPTGLAVVEALSNTVNRATDLLFIGSQLPDMPGVELVDRLYRDGLTGEKHIIWLSGIDARDSHLLPPEVCELKEPVTRDELHTLLESTLGKDGERSRSTGMEEVAEGVVRIGGQVLLVEDNPVNQEVIAGMLAAVDCVVDTVPDGRSGVRMARDKTYDVILMDFRLPDIDGAEVTRQIRAGETGASRVPIIALTANAASEDRERCFNAGMDDFLAKPCTIGALAETLGRWISLSYPDAEEAADASDATTAEPWVSRFDELNLARIRGLRRPDGSDLLSHAVDVFFRTSEETMETIVSAVHGRDAALLESAAHKLKSGCANLGAISMAAACRELEEMARRGALSGAAALVEQLHNEHTLANDWLEEQVREFA